MWLLKKSNNIKAMEQRIKFLEEENQNLKSDIHSLKGYIKGVESTLELFYKTQTTHNHNLTLMNDKNMNTNITDSTIHGSVATAETIDNSRHQSFDGTASNANINFGDNAILTNTVQPLDNQDEKHTSH